MWIDATYIYRFASKTRRVSNQKPGAPCFVKKTALKTMLSIFFRWAHATVQYVQLQILYLGFPVPNLGYRNSPAVVFGNVKEFRRFKFGVLLI